MLNLVLPPEMRRMLMAIVVALVGISIGYLVGGWLGTIIIIVSIIAGFWIANNEQKGRNKIKHSDDQSRDRDMPND